MITDWPSKKCARLHFFLGHLFYLQYYAKDKNDSHTIIVWYTVLKGLQRKTKLTLFWVKMVNICKKKISPLSLFAICASDNLVYNLLQRGTFYAHYTCTLSHKN